MDRDFGSEWADHEGQTEYNDAYVLSPLAIEMTLRFLSRRIRIRLFTGSPGHQVNGRKPK